MVKKKVGRRTVSCGGWFRDGFRRTSYQTGTRKGMIYRVCGVIVVGLWVDMIKMSRQVNISEWTRREEGRVDGVGK
jgi:hypothetical protein